MEPPSPAPSRPSTQEKIDRVPQPYAFELESAPSARSSPQDKLRHERLRMLGGGESGPTRPLSSMSRTSLPPSYRSSSPAPTFASLPPYTPGPSRPQPSTREHAQTQKRTLLGRLGLGSSQSRSQSLEPESVLVHTQAASARPLPSTSQLSINGGCELENESRGL